MADPVIPSDPEHYFGAKTPKKPEWMLRNTIHQAHWDIFSLKDCDFTKKAIKLLEEHGETSLAVRGIDTVQYQKMVTQGTVYSPLIYRNGQVLGSYGELVLYYERNFLGDYETIINQ